MPAKVKLMRVWMGSVYPLQSASTRLRLHQLAQTLSEQGHEVASWHFLGDASLDQWVAGGRGRFVPLLKGIERTSDACKVFSNKSIGIVQRECLPINSVWVERHLEKTTPFIWDIDDAIWETKNPTRQLFRGGVKKSAWLASHASEIWAGNQVVADWCTQHSDAPVLVVPTTTPIPIAPSQPIQPLRLAWVGSPSTGPFIEQLIWELKSELRNWVVDVVGAQITVPQGVRVVQLPWSQFNEDTVLSRAWVGLYPVDTSNKFVNGKSGLKAVLFGAYGLPTIATRTASNAAIIKDGETGRLVSTWSEWRDSLKILRDEKVRNKWGAAARSRILESYDPKYWTEFQTRRLEFHSGFADG